MNPGVSKPMGRIGRNRGRTCFLFPAVMGRLRACVHAWIVESFSPLSFSFQCSWQGSRLCPVHTTSAVPSASKIKLSPAVLYSPELRACAPALSIYIRYLLICVRYGVSDICPALYCVSPTAASPNQKIKRSKV